MSVISLPRSFTAERLLAPAKLNLHLAVTGQTDPINQPTQLNQSNKLSQSSKSSQQSSKLSQLNQVSQVNQLNIEKERLHILDSLFHTVSLADVLVVKPAEKMQLTLVENDFSRALHEAEGGTGIGIKQFLTDNILIKTWRLLQARYGIRDELAIDLEKNIPMGAGLGGGSSDAAALLRWAGQAYGLSWSLEEQVACAREIGSDVPFFLSEGMAWVSGTGETIERLPVSLRHLSSSFRLGIIDIGETILTKEAYQRFVQIGGAGESALLKKRLNEILRDQHASIQTMQDRHQATNPEGSVSSRGEGNEFPVNGEFPVKTGVGEFSVESAANLNSDPTPTQMRRSSSQMIAQKIWSLLRNEGWNAFETGVFEAYPRISRIAAELRAEDIFVRLTGSGAALFFMVEEKAYSQAEMKGNFSRGGVDLHTGEGESLGTKPIEREWTDRICSLPGVRGVHWVHFTGE